MEQSLIAAVSGIAADQTYLDVIGSNIANSNTTAYKSQTAQFTDLLAEQISGASAPVAGGQSGGINPISVGAGVRIGAVTSNESQGAIQATNVPTDVAIQGNGFLVAQQYGQTVYTRDGNLTLDANGNLATQSGGLVQGWMANSQGVISTSAPTGPLTIPTSTTMPATATTQMTLGGNLPAWSSTSTPITTTINAYDSLGNAVPVTFTFTPGTTANTWTVQGTVPNPTNPTGTPTNLWTTPPTITFGPSPAGQITAITGATTNADGSMSLQVPTPAGYAFPSSSSGSTSGTGTSNWTINFPSPSSPGAVTQYSGQQSLSVTGVDGYSAGTLSGYSIGSDGVIEGSFSNGETLAIGQIALAQFSNPGGLNSQGNLMYTQSSNSGQPIVGAAGTGGLGSLVGGALEGSNVNLSSQLTDLIVAQEAYQANTKVVSTTAANLNALAQMA
ncbi:MAG: flagellar hook protein FlgE [Acidimicrobiales bacterium]